MSGRTAVDPRLAASLAALYLIWGSTYLAMRIAVSELPPLLMASMRFVGAGSIMLLVALRRGATWPRAIDWARMLPIGALFCVGGNGLVAIGELSVSSGGAAVVCATMPLWVGVLGVITGERPTAREWLSLVVGFIGVVVLMGGPSLAGQTEHVVALMFAPVCWALASVLSRRLPKRANAAGDTFMQPAMQMLTGGMLLAIVGAASGERLPVHASTESWLAVAYLCIFGSLIGFTAYSWLLRNARPAVATSYAFVNPILAVVIGAVLSGEPLGISTVIANVLIVGAVMLVLARPKPRV
jgi:drug/metabolite transporter (DMT)-like permease